MAKRKAAIYASHVANKMAKRAGASHVWVAKAGRGYGVVAPPSTRATLPGTIAGIAVREPDRQYKSRRRKFRDLLNPVQGRRPRRRRRPKPNELYPQPSVFFGQMEDTARKTRLRRARQRRRNKIYRQKLAEAGYFD